MIGNMVYSFMLVNYNMSGLVECCIESIETEVGSDTYEIIVADNSTDPMFRLADSFAELHKRVRLVRLSENRGWIDSLNAILPFATGDYVIIMHPDVTFGGGCLRTLRHFLEANQTAGIVSPNLYYPDGTENRLRLRFPGLRTELRRVLNVIPRAFLKRNAVADEIFWDRSTNSETDMVMSVCMMIRGSVLERVGRSIAA